MKAPLTPKKKEVEELTRKIETIKSEREALMQRAEQVRSNMKGEMLLDLLNHKEEVHSAKVGSTVEE